jgi:hypothetical protein
MSDLNAIFNARNPRQFQNQLAVADRISSLSVSRQMSVGETLDALICSLVSIVQARAQPAEWGAVGETLCDEIKRRLTVTGDTGPLDYRRKMV